MRRTLRALVLAGMVAVLGYNAWHSDTLYFYWHQSALEALAQESFRDRNITQLSRAKSGEPHWFINSDLVSRDVAATQKAHPQRPSFDFATYLKTKHIRRSSHDALYRRLEALDLEGFFANADRRTAEFYRERNGRRVSYFYSEGGELEPADPTSYQTILLDTQWSLRRY